MFTSANERRKIQEARIRNEVEEELRSIYTKMDACVGFDLTLNSVPLSETLQALRDNGYEVYTGSQYNEDYCVITW